MTIVTRLRLLELHARLTKEAVELMQLKNADYGASADALANFRLSELVGIPMESGIICRLCDKVARIGHIVTSGKVNVKAETVQDTLVDAINYLVILAAAIEEREVNNVQPNSGD